MDVVNVYLFVAPSPCGRESIPQGVPTCLVLTYVIYNNNVQSKNHTGNNEITPKFGACRVC